MAITICFTPYVFLLKKMLPIFVLSYVVKKQVQKQVTDWLGVAEVREVNSLLLHQSDFNRNIRLQYKNHFQCFFWITVCWSLWGARNTILFEEGILVGLDILGQIQRQTREQFLVRFNNKVEVLWSIWIANPSSFLFLLRVFYFLVRTLVLRSLSLRRLLMLRPCLY